MENIISESNGVCGVKIKAQTDVQRAFDFVAKVIESSQDTFHLKCCQRLVAFFKDSYYDKHGGQKAHDSLLNLLVAKIPMLVELT